MIPSSFHVELKKRKRLMKKNVKFLSAIGMFLSFLPSTALALNYLVTPLVSNTMSIVANNTDPNLINPWGLFFVPNSGQFWVADNGSNLATLYGSNGVVLPVVKNVLSNPTGIKHNTTTTQFKITKGLATAPASFVFATESGTVLGFNNSVDPLNAIIAVDNSATGAVYKGLDFGTNCCANPQLFVTDFHNAKVDVFDGQFDLVLMLKDFTLPVGYAPFNIKLINNLIYVTYAKQKSPLNHDDDPGPGNGFVNVFNRSGSLITRLISNGNLNSPWGLALAPATFGQFSGSLLVGNFGDGKINAYDPYTGAFHGQLQDALGNPIIIDGLWSLEFNSAGTLYFTSGPNGETNGLVGTITPL